MVRYQQPSAHRGCGKVLCVLFRYRSDLIETENEE